MGRVAKPEALAKLQGYPRKQKVQDKINEEVNDQWVEQLVAEGPPQHFRPSSKDTKEKSKRKERLLYHWEDTVENLIDMKLLTKKDQAKITRYVEMLVMWEELRDSVWEDGYTLTKENQYGPYEIQNPKFKLMLEVFDKLLRSAKEFGFTPASRASLKMDALKDPTNPFGQIMSGALASNPKKARQDASKKELEEDNKAKGIRQWT